ncbi:hypothetical protein R80B4_03005 [Fibrobacteres bacterium R8-0-B4]
MDNSIAKCAACGADVNLGDTTCQKCGNPITSTPQKSSQMARLLNKFAGKIQNGPPSAQDAQETASALQPAYAAEPAIAFASGLPAWSIEPPAVVVRRKTKT